MIDIPQNGNSIWRTIAMSAISVIVGFFAHSLLETNEPAQGRANGTGWSKDQEQRFLTMPEHIDSAWLAGIRNQVAIIDLEKKILTELQRRKR